MSRDTARAQFEELLRSSWEAQSRLLLDPNVGSWLVRFATPVLTFGRWQTAKIATAGLNPSEREFCHKRMKGDEPPGKELEAAERRLLHRRMQGDYSSPSDSALSEAREKIEHYFDHKPYWEWFKKFEPMLNELGCSFKAGASGAAGHDAACHTDYVSPFATTTGIGSVEQEDPAVVEKLQAIGLPLWKNALGVMPELRLVLGIGRGWSLMPKLFDFDSWEAITTPFDHKGRGNGKAGHLNYKLIEPDGREIHLFWWRPNLNGIPLALLSEEEKADLGRRARDISGFSC